MLEGLYALAGEEYHARRLRPKFGRSSLENGEGFEIDEPRDEGDEPAGDTPPADQGGGGAPADDAAAPREEDLLPGGDDSSTAADTEADGQFG